MRKPNLVEWMAPLVWVALVLASGCMAEDEPDLHSRSDSGFSDVFEESPPDHVSPPPAGSPRMVITPDPLLFSAIPVGETQNRSLQVNSDGGSSLVIHGIEVTSGDDAFSISAPGLPLMVEPGERHAVTVTHTRTTDAAITGALRIESNAGHAEVRLQAPALIEQLAASPSPLSFGSVPVGTSRVRTLTIQNVGNAQVEVSDVTLDARADLRFASATDAGAEHFRPVLPLTLGATESFFLDFVCTPPDDQPINGDLVVRTGGGQALVVPINCNGPQSCIEVSDTTGRVNDRTIDFGAVAVGVEHARTIVVRNCAQPNGDDLEVRGVAVGGDSAFTIAGLGEERLPMTLAPGETDTFNVTCNPDAVRAYSSSLTFDSNDSDQNPLVIPMACIGTSNNPPVADAQCRVTTPGRATSFSRDFSTVPFVTVECTCIGSTDPDGDEIDACLWMADKPSGATTSGTGSPSEPFSFFLDEIGDYEVCLTVTDSPGATSVESDCVRLTAIPESELICRLVWQHQFGGSSDPLDLDAPPERSRGCGADLDLHAVPSTGPTWFSEQAVHFDRPSVFWPDGESASLDANVRFGVGPEVITISSPAPGVAYTCGVHYQNDYGWSQYPDAGGWADATLEVYVGGIMVAEFQRRMNQTYEFWEAVQITWQAPVPGDGDIIPRNNLYASHCESSLAGQPCSPVGSTDPQPPCWR